MSLSSSSCHFILRPPSFSVACCLRLQRTRRPTDRPSVLRSSFFPTICSVIIAIADYSQSVCLYANRLFYLDRRCLSGSCGRSARASSHVYIFCPTRTPASLSDFYSSSDLYIEYILSDTVDFVRRHFFGALALLELQLHRAKQKAKAVTKSSYCQHPSSLRTADHCLERLCFVLPPGVD